VKSVGRAKKRGAFGFGRVLSAAAIAGAGLMGAACEAPCALARCDVRDASCQEEVARAAACVRGVRPVRVRVAVMAREDYVRERVRRATEVSEADREAARLRDVGLWLFRLAPADASAETDVVAHASRVAALYSPSARQIFIIDDGEPLDSLEAVRTLAHEYAHALQDVAGAFDDEARVGPGLDGALGYGALIEGEAVLVEDLLTLDLFGTDRDRVPWDDVFAQWQRRVRRFAAETEVPLVLAGPTFYYAFGAQFVTDAYRRGGMAAVDGLHERPPQSAREVLATLRAGSRDEGAALERLDDVAVPMLPDGYLPIFVERFGAWVVERFLERMGDERPADRSVEVVGDSFSIFVRNRDGDVPDVVAAWRLRLDTADAARSLGERIAMRGEGAFRVMVEDRDVSVLAANRADARDHIAGDVPFRPAPPPVGAPEAQGTARVDPMHGRDVACFGRPSP
jgi:hypothetical protein